MPLAFRFRICWLLVICGYWSKNKSPESGRERIENTHSNDKRVKKTKNRNKLHAICEGKNKNTRKYARRINERENSKKENDKKRKQTSIGGGNKVIEKRNTLKIYFFTQLVREVHDWIVDRVKRRMILNS